MSIGAIVGRDRRRPALPPELVGRLLLVWLAIAALLVITNVAEVWHVLGSDPQKVAAPLLTIAAVVLLVGRIAYRLFDEEVAGLAALACGLAVPLIEQLRPPQAGGSGWQVVAVLAAANGLMARSPRLGGWTIGASLGLALALSPDMLPLTLAFVAVAAAKWLRNRCERGWMVHTTLALAAAVGAGFMLSGGLLEGSYGCSGVDPMHLAVFAWLAAITAVNAWLEPHPKAFTLGGMGIAAAGAAAIAWQWAPTCLVGLPVSPAATSWLGRGLDLIEAQAVPVLGLWATLRLIGPACDWLRRWWSDYAALLAAGIAISMFDPQVSGAVCALAAVPLGWQLREWIRASRNARRPQRRALVLAGMALALAPAAPLSLLLTAAPGQAAGQAGR